jgi:hypothetical protein
MNLPTLSFAALVLAGGLSFSPASSLQAQDAPAPVQTTQTTVTTTLPDQTQTTRTTTVTTAPVQPVVPAAVPVEQIAPARPGQHVVEIEIVLTHGSVEAYFGRAPRGEKLSLGDASIRIKLPSTATVTKIVSRDKDSDGPRHVTPSDPWHVVAPFDGPGRFVFNIVEWDDDAAAAEILVKVDGNVMFEGHGTDDDFSNWANKFYGPEVHKTGSREIAFTLP